MSKTVFLRQNTALKPRKVQNKTWITIRCSILRIKSTSKRGANNNSGIIIMKNLIFIVGLCPGNTTNRPLRDRIKVYREVQTSKITMYNPQALATRTFRMF